MLRPSEHRRRSARDIATVAGALLALAAAPLAGSATAATTERLRSCLAANAPRKSSALAVQLSTRDRVGEEWTHRGRIFWRRSSAGRSESLICMLDPPAIRGLAYLISEGESDVNLWSYLPEKGRVMQLHLRGAARRARIERTAISYDDLRYLPMNLSAMEAENVTDSIVDGRRVSEVRLSRPRGEDVIYQRIVAFVDEQSCVPLRIEFYAAEDELLKVVTANPASIAEVGGVQIPRALRVEDLKAEVQTEVRIGDIQIDGPSRDEMFVPSQLARNVCGR